MIDVPKMGLDAIVNQDNGFDLFRVALGLGWKTPNTYWPILFVYINRITYLGNTYLERNVWIELDSHY